MDYWWVGQLPFDEGRSKTYILWGVCDALPPLQQKPLPKHPLPDKHPPGTPKDAPKLQPAIRRGVARVQNMGLRPLCSQGGDWLDQGAAASAPGAPCLGALSLIPDTLEFKKLH